MLTLMDAFGETHELKHQLVLGLSSPQHSTCIMTLLFGDSQMSAEFRRKRPETSQRGRFGSNLHPTLPMQKLQLLQPFLLPEPNPPRKAWMEQITRGGKY